MANGGSNGNEETSRAVELLLADLKHFQESFWRNEETGERRVNFFLSLVTAVIAALVTFETAEESGFLEDARVNATMFMALAGLLLVGWVTFRRVVMRNKVSEEFKGEIDYVRDVLSQNAFEGYRPFKKPNTSNDENEEEETWLVFRIKGGLASLVAVINGIIATPLVWLVTMLAVGKCCGDYRSLCFSFVGLFAVGVAGIFVRYQIMSSARARKQAKSEVRKYIEERDTGWIRAPQFPVGPP